VPDPSFLFHHVAGFCIDQQFRLVIIRFIKSVFLRALEKFWRWLRELRAVTLSDEEFDKVQTELADGRFFIHKKYPD
jgi:hypothetical protein